MAKTYTAVAEFPSKSNPAKAHTVSRDEVGELSCSCPAWKFKKGNKPRTCKHVKAYESGFGERIEGAETVASTPAEQPEAAPTEGLSLAEKLQAVGVETPGPATAPTAEELAEKLKL